MRPILLVAPAVLACLSPYAAQASCSSFSAADFAELAARADAAITRDDVVAHGDLYRELQAQLPCLAEPLPASEWARFLYGLSLVEFALGRPWQSALDTALQIDPRLDRSTGPEEIRTFVPAPSVAVIGTLAPDGVVFVDGLVVQRPPVLDGVHIVQRNIGDEWSTRLLQPGTPFPTEWLVGRDEPVSSPPPSPSTGGRVPRGRPGWLVGGGAAVVLGAAGGVGTWAYAMQQSEITRSRGNTLVAANTVAWSVVAVGGALGLTGALLPRRTETVSLSFGPRGVALGGQF